MRPVEFTSDSIIHAGQQLVSAERTVTGFALRKIVGGGNPTRLKQVWDEHMASQSVTAAEPVAELPVEVAEEVATVTKALTDRLSALAVQLNDKAVKAADRRVHEIVRSAGDQRTLAERELSDAAQTVDDLEEKLDESNSNLDDLKSKFAGLQATSHSQDIELAQLRERLLVTEQAAKTAEIQHVQGLKLLTDQHVAELERTNSAIETDRVRHLQESGQLRTELLEQKKVIEAAASDRDKLYSELATVKARFDAAEQLHQDQRKSFELEIQRFVERIARVEADNLQAQKEANAAREDSAKLRGQIESMQTQSADLVRALSERNLQS